MLLEQGHATQLRHKSVIQCQRIRMDEHDLNELVWLCCRQAAEEASGQMQDELSKLADDLVQKFEDQWKDTAENLDAASKAFDNLEGMLGQQEPAYYPVAHCQSSGLWHLICADPCLVVQANCTPRSANTPI